MKLSVILPAFMAQATIGLAVKSTLVAMPKESELIVLIEGPRFPEYDLGHIRDGRLKVVYREKAEGIVSALNHLISLASGDYIARMDADDVTLPWRFRAQMRRIRKGDVDFVFMNAVLFGSEIKPFGILPQPPVAIDSTSLSYILAYANPLVHPTMLARREALLELGGYPLATAEDYALWLQASIRDYRLVRLANFGLLYRYHVNQLSQQSQVRDGWTRDQTVASLMADLKKLHAISLDEDVADIERALKEQVSKRIFWFRLQYGILGPVIENLRKTFLTLR